MLTAIMLFTAVRALAEDPVTYEEYEIRIAGNQLVAKTVTNSTSSLLLPLRAVAEAGGASVDWDGTNRVIRIVNQNGAETTLQIDTGLIYQGIYRYDLDAPNVIYDDRTYVTSEVLERSLEMSAEVNTADKTIVFYAATPELKDDDNTISVLPVEDTYVRVNDGANYGQSETLAYCNDPDRTELYQRGYLKFDLSGIPMENLSAVRLRYTALKNPEWYWTGQRPAWLKLYEVEPDAWRETELTYFNQPAQGEYVADGQAIMGTKHKVVADGADITEYIKKKLSEGVTRISFVFDAKETNRQSSNMLSREYAEYMKRPRLFFDYNVEEALDLSGYPASDFGNGVDPLENAKKMIAESTATYDEEYQGTKPVYHKIESEYSETVDARLAADSDYTGRPTRLLSTLKDYTPVSEDPALSRYGGDLNRKYDEGTGFFRVEKIDGRWWFIDPEGYLMYSYAKCNVRPTDKEEYYKEMADNGLTKQAWAEKERDYFKNDLKFNSLGGWSFLFRPLNDDATFAGSLNLEAVEGKDAMPFGSIRVYGVGILYGKTIDGVIPGGVETFKGNVPPVFNPDFEEKCHEIIKEYVTPWKDNPYIMGWWSDNEIDETLTMLDKALNLDPNDPLYVYTYVTAWEWLKERTGKQNPTVYDITDKLRDDYREFIYDRYYKVMSEGFKKYAPNHLFFGNRHYEFAVDEPGIIRAAARYCDVISFNLYKKWTPDVVDKWAEYTDKPFLITEWYARPQSATGGWVCETSEDCGKFYQHFALRLLEAKNVVGFHFFTQVIGEEQENYVREFNPNVYNLIQFFDERNR